MSNLKNSTTLIMNKGTAKSGWWNPDHAARVAAGNISFVDNLNGDGKTYCAAILSNFAVDRAYKNTRFYGQDTGIEDMGSSLMKDIRGQAKKDKDLDKGKLWQKEEIDGKEQDTTLYIVQYEAIAHIVKNTDRIADMLGDYAISSSSSDHKEYPLNRIGTEIKNLQKFVKSNPETKNVSYVDADKKHVPINKVFETNLRSLEKYRTEMKQLGV